MWVPAVCHRYPKLFEAWFLFTNVVRYLLDGRDGDFCDGCFLWFPNERLTQHIFMDGSMAPQCLECEAWVGMILADLDG